MSEESSSSVDETESVESTEQAASGTAKTHAFQTEARQLLQLMIHSLYSNREIFLRELISNASDAIDKLRFERLSRPELNSGTDPEIRIFGDKEAGTLTISDNGIGMSQEDLIDHLGTIAKSGTAEFLGALSGDDKKDAQLIGQFGVGFYSAFIVADEVEVISRRAGEEQASCWRSRGESDFTMAPATREANGTDVILHLREDAQEFLESFRLNSIISKYSDHISVPVMLPIESPPADNEGDDGEQEQDGQQEVQFKAVNEGKALWTRSRTDVSDDEYKEFYKHVAHDFEDPLIWSHNRVEGKLEYTSLLYLPKRAPFDLWNREAPRGVKLYVQRVFIMDEAEQFLPHYLRFVKGVVDSNDLPLNVSREILQQDGRVDSIRAALTKRVLDMLKKLAKDDTEQYQAFWNEFGNVLKEGPAEDFSNRETLAGLMRFHTTHDAGSAAADDQERSQSHSLADYVARLPEGQDKIFYLCAENLVTASASPHLEKFRKHNIEVVLATDRIDDWLMNSLGEFDGKQLQDITRADLDLDALFDEADTPERNETEEQTVLAQRMQDALGDGVDSVKVSRRLVDSPACLVVSEQDMGAQMRRVLKAAGQEVPESRPVLEINPSHPFLQKMDQESDEDKFALWAKIILDQAALAEGEQLEDPAAYVQNVNKALLELM